ncbi:MAG: hypothetical protein JXB35_08115, partial [Anaerolineae bacterium]|nr:hypothetical protein [Anaerolineae bacterium]
MTRRKLVVPAVVLIFSLLFSMLTVEPRPVMAATFTVDSNGDAGDANLLDGVCDDGSGNCTLRAAIEQINHNADASNTITIGAGVGTITLTGGELLIRENLTIQGAGIGATVVDGNNNDRVFRVFNPPRSLTASFSNMTITGGGGVFSWGGPTHGGGIYAHDNTTLTLTNMRFEDNTAPRHGGAVYARGPLTIDSCEFVDNSSQNETGGAVHGVVGAMQIRDSYFEDNHADGALG